MAVNFKLPKEIEYNLRAHLGDLDQAIKEAALVELYRQGKISPRELAESMGISRLEIESLLKRHGVTEDLPTAAEIEEDVKNLQRLLE